VSSRGRQLGYFLDRTAQSHEYRSHCEILRVACDRVERHLDNLMVVLKKQSVLVFLRVYL
jgi:hypothetical protein